MPNRQYINEVKCILNAFEDSEITAYQFLHGLLSTNVFEDHPITLSIIEDLDTILDTLISARATSDQTGKWVFRSAEKRYQTQVLQLTKKESGLHFLPGKITNDQLMENKIEKLSMQMHHHAPDVWKLVANLLAADPMADRRQARLAYRKAGSGTQKADPRLNDGDIMMGDVVGDGSEDETSENSGHIRLIDEDEDAPEDLTEQAQHQFNSLIVIKQVLCLSIMMHSTNQRCNSLQSIIGVFLHACNTPDAVLELLAHLGVSISPSTISSAVSNLSKESSSNIRKLGRTLLTLYAYDNLDVDLKHLVPTVENPLNTLVHLTTGSMLPVIHDVTLDDLDCAEFLWKRYQHNFHALPQDIPNIPFEKLFEIHPEDTTGGPSRRKRFNAWKCASDLIEFGPPYFRKFRRDLGDPEVVDAIPVVKTFQTPLRTLDISPSSPGTNASALEMFFLQSGVGDPNRTPNAQDPQNRVILISGDLLTIQHLRSLQMTRAEESTPWGRVQFMVPVMGLFHLKMACADAIWRIFIHNKAKELGPNDLIAHIGQIRPKETRKIETKPGFRRMHECIQHVGIVSRLEVWRLAAKDKFPGAATLEDFADLTPEWDVLQEMATQIASRNPTHAKFSRMRARKAGERDQQLENMMLREEYFLLYEEISHGLNHGDIGRVESCFMPWALIFAGCGKHKYAAEMRRYLEDIHFVYPEGLRHAIRMNILCNPTGKKGHFRPIDWVIEHNNLYIKRIYGGKFSNHTQERIMKESALIEVYKSIRIQFEQMFCLEHRTIRHSPPKMKNTFDKLGEYMRKESTHTEVKGREAHSIIDAMAKGMHMAMTGHALGGSLANDSGELGDDAEEVDDDGSLDV